MRAMFPLVFAFFLIGCGTTREAASVKNETITVETQGVTPEGKPYAEVEKTERVETVDSKAKTTVDAPEIKAIVTAAAAVTTPGLGGILGSIFGWAKGTPEGALATTGILGLVGAVAKRGLDGERNLKKTTSYLEAVVEGNSNFMQAHPEHADLLKSHQRSAQVDPELKTAVKDVRIKRGLV